LLFFLLFYLCWDFQFETRKRFGMNFNFKQEKIWIKIIIYGIKLKTLVWNKNTMQCEGEFGTTKYTTT
jgi:hypothetical protein